MNILRTSTLLGLLFWSSLSSAQQNDTDSLAMSISLDDVVVTAQYAPTDSKNAIQSIRVITRDEMDEQGATNLEQLLQQDLNIQIRQDMVLGSSMSLLGIEGENVKIMMDGVPIVGRLNGSIDLSQINLSNIERVEIVEGPMSVSYGTDALAGVINLISKKSQLYNYQISLTRQQETRGENSTMIDGGVRLDERWLVRVNGGFDRFQGFSLDSLRSLPWNPKEQWYADASVRYDFSDDHKLRYQLSYFDEEVQNLGDIRRPEFKPYAFDDYYLTQRMNHTLAHEGTIGDDYYWQTTLGHNQFEREVHAYRMDLESENLGLLEADTTIFRTWMTRSVFASKLRDSKLNFQVGLDLRRETGNGDRMEDGSSISDYAVFGSLRYQLSDPLLVEAGLRAAKNSRYDAPVIPSVHLKYKISNALSLRASYAKGFRSPSLKELFLSFIDVNHFIVGNADLLAERSDNIQLDLSYRKKHFGHRFSARLHSFYNRISDQIQLFPFEEIDGNIVPTTPDLSAEYTYFNIAKSRTMGINTRLGYQWKDLQIQTGISNIGYFNPLSEELDMVEPFTYSLELNGKIGYTFPQIKTNTSLFIRHHDRLISYYPMIENGKTVARQRIQDGFTMMDATISRPFFNRRMTLTAGVRNLLDIQQVNVLGNTSSNPHGGSSDRLPIGVGRSFFVRATVRLFDNGAARFVNRSFEEQRKAALRLYSTPKGDVYASWIENRNDNEQVLQFAKRSNNNWTRPQTIAIGDDRWFVNEIDAPQLASYLNDDASLVSFWLKGNSKRNVYDHDIVISQSKNGGKSWKSKFMPYKTDIPAFYGLCKFVPLPNKRMLAVWMDGRDTKEEKDNGRFYPKMDGKLQLQAVEFDQAGKQYHATQLSDHIAKLCPFDAAALPEGAIVAFRDFDKNISTTRYLDGKWSEPQAIQNDKWRIPATIESPAVDTDEEKVVVAWYSKPRSGSQIFLAFSDDQGASFATKLSVNLDHRPLGKVDVVWRSSNSVQLSWLEKVAGNTYLSTAVVERDGTVKEQQQIAQLPSDQFLSAPILTKAINEVLLMWKPTPESDYQLRALQIEDF